MYAAEKKHIIPAPTARAKDIESAAATRWISLKRLIVNGPAKFKTIKMNHREVMAGMVAKIPLFEIRLRVCVRVYNKFPPPNMPEDVNPCANIIHTPPTRPDVMGAKILVITMLI